jgi:serine/threonine protein kinase
MSSHKIIGQGTYGKIYKPSLECRDGDVTTIDYSNLVSKLLKKKHAQTEMNEFIRIGEIDPHNKYHLGTPILCVPSTKTVSSKMDSNVRNNPSKYRLLIQKYGGGDVAKLCSTIRINKYIMSPIELAQYKIHSFWKEVIQLFKGLRLMQSNRIVHNDIKPSNILFNEETGKFSYIDFGLMTSFEQMMSTSSASSNPHANYHWSYPLETGLMNQDKFKQYSSETTEWRAKYASKFTTYISHYSADKPASKLSPKSDFRVKNPSGFNVFFYYIYLPDTRVPQKYKWDTINAYFNYVNPHIANMRYDSFLDNAVKSIDIFGLGFTLQFMANSFQRQKLITNEFYTKCTELFSTMYTYDPSARQTSASKLTKSYMAIFNYYGDTCVHPNVRATVSHTVCLPNKEYNYVSRKCVKKCAHSYLRHPYTRNCVRDKNSCPSESKEYNPFTRRCNKKCAKGHTRIIDIKSGKFACVRDTDACTAASKDYNPFTRRCNKKCAKGYTRKANVRSRKFVCVRSDKS